MSTSRHILGYAMLQQATSLGFQFLSFLILVRLLSTEYMGVWSLYLTFHVFIETARMGFIHNGLINQLVGNKSHQNEIFSAALFLQLVVTILISVLFMLIVELFYLQLQAPQLLRLAYYYPIVAFPAAVAQLFQSLQTSHHNFRVIWFSVIGTSLGNILGVVGLIFLENRDNLLWLMLFQGLGYFLGACIITFFSRRDIKLSPVKIEWVNKLFHFGKFSASTGLGSMIYKKVDILMIGFMINPQAVALYSIASRIINYLEVPLTAIAQVYYPKVSERIQATSKKEFPLYTIQRAIAWMMWAVIPLAIFLIIFPELIIRILAGTAYLPSAPILQIFAFISLIKPFGRMIGITMDAAGRPDLNLKILLGSILVNLVMNIILIQYMGTIGAALATMFSTWIVILAGQYLVSRIFHFHYPTFIKGIGKSFLGVFKELKLHVKRLITV